MKKLILLIAFLATAILMTAQAPQGINFQTIVYDNSNIPVSGQTVDVRFSIMSANNPNTIIYQEKHDDVTTDAFGQLALVIGEGSPLVNTFSQADWGAGDMYELKVEIDLSAVGTSYTDMGTRKFFTVPYAFYAEKAGSVEGMWEKNGNDIYYKDGNVGVGTQNPTAQLHIGKSGGLVFGQGLNTNQADLISLYNNRLGKARMIGLGFESAPFINGNGQIANERILYSRAEGGFHWYLRSLADGGASAAMLMNRDGDVAIGLDAPRALLHIDQKRSITNTRDGSFIIGKKNGTGTYLTMDANEIQSRNQGPNGTTGTTLRLNRLHGDVAIAEKGNGRVGIGTLYPGTALHVAVGTNANLSNARGYLILGKENQQNLVMDNNEIQSRNDGLASNLLLQKSGGKLGIGAAHSNARVNISDENWQLRIANPTSGAADWHIGASANFWAIGEDKLVFSTDNASPNGTLTLHGDAKGASIGTAELPDGYKLSVDGKVICEELHVEMSQSWPDYVFSDSYPLMSLEEVAASIAREHHLPGLPDAATIEAEGLDVAAMQRLQMEKIEELTLYVIQLKAEIEALKREAGGEMAGNGMAGSGKAGSENGNLKNE